MARILAALCQESGQRPVRIFYHLTFLFWNFLYHIVFLVKNIWLDLKIYLNWRVFAIKKRIYLFIHLFTYANIWPILISPNLLVWSNLLFPHFLLEVLHLFLRIFTSYYLNKYSFLKFILEREPKQGEEQREDEKQTPHWAGSLM